MRPSLDLSARGWLIIALSLLFALATVLGLVLGDVFEARHVGSAL